MAAPIYATIDDYTDWAGDQNADIPDVLFARASAVVDEILIGAVYTVDQNTQVPTDQTIREALRDATCAQAQLMHQSSSGTDGDNVEWDSVSIGSVHLSGRRAPSVPTAGTTVSGQDVAADAVRVLRVAGVLPAGVLTYG